MKQIIRQIAKITVIVIVTIIGIETVVRFILWKPSNPWEQYRLEKKFQTSPLGIVDTNFSPDGLGDLVPNQDGIWRFGLDKPYHVKTNSLGFRNNEELNENEDMIRILAVGDSFTFGPFVNNEDTWTAWLETILNRQLFPDQQVQVLNAGFPGYTITDEIAYMKDKGLNVNPDLVILDVTPNDVRDFAPDKRATFARPKNRKRTEDSPDSNPFIDMLRNLLESNSATFQLTRDIRFQVTIQNAEQMMNGNELANDDPDDGDLTTDKSVEFQDLYTQYLPQYKTNFDKFVSLLREKDIPLIVVYFPTHDQLPADSSTIQQENLAQMTLENDVPFLDLLPYYRESGNELTLYLYTYDTELGYVGNGHPSRYGYYVSADAIAKFLIEENLLPEK